MIRRYIIKIYQILTDTEILIKRLNEHNQETQTMYQAIDDLKSSTAIDMTPPQHTEILEKIDNLKRLYKSILIAFAQNDEGSIDAFSNEFRSIIQFLDEINVSPKQKTLWMPTLDRIRTADSLLEKSNSSFNLR
jgi:hypothetical protein